MSSARTVSYKGPGFLQLLTLLFIGLKLAGAITWSWWWVLAPLWGPFVVAAVVAVGLLFVGVLVLSISGILRRVETRRKRKQLQIRRKQRRSA